MCSWSKMKWLSHKGSMLNKMRKHGQPKDVSFLKLGYLGPPCTQPLLLTQGFILKFNNLIFKSELRFSAL